MARDVDDLACLASVDGKRLFAQYRLAGVQAHQGVFRVQIVRRGNINGVDFRIVHQGLVAGVGLHAAGAHSKFRGKSLRGVDLPRGDCCQGGIGYVAQTLREGAGDLAGAEYAPADE